MAKAIKFRSRFGRKYIEIPDHYPFVCWRIAKWDFRKDRELKETETRQDEVKE